METLYMDACGDTQMPIQSEEDQQEKTFKAGEEGGGFADNKERIRKGTHKLDHLTI